MLDANELFYLAGALALMPSARKSGLVVEIVAYRGTHVRLHGPRAGRHGRAATISSIDPFERVSPDPLNPQGSLPYLPEEVAVGRLETVCVPMVAYSQDAAPASARSHRRACGRWRPPLRKRSSRPRAVRAQAPPGGWSSWMTTSPPTLAYRSHRRVLRGQRPGSRSHKSYFVIARKAGGAPAGRKAGAAYTGLPLQAAEFMGSTYYDATTQRSEPPPRTGRRGGGRPARRLRGLPAARASASTTSRTSPSAAERDDRLLYTLGPQGGQPRSAAARSAWSHRAQRRGKHAAPADRPRTRNRLPAVQVRGRVAPCSSWGPASIPSSPAVENGTSTVDGLGFPPEGGRGAVRRYRLLRRPCASSSNRPMRTYSSGMIVRLGFASATDIQPASSSWTRCSRWGTPISRTVPAKRTGAPRQKRSRDQVSHDLGTSRRCASARPGSTTGASEPSAPPPKSSSSTRNPSAPKAWYGRDFEAASPAVHRSCISRRGGFLRRGEQR